MDAVDNCARRDSRIGGLQVISSSKAERSFGNPGCVGKDTVVEGEVTGGVAMMWIVLG